MNRRTLLKTMIAALASIGTLRPQKLFANISRKVTSPYKKMVVFGIDSLRIDLAEKMHRDGCPAIGSLNPPICVLSGGAFSVTQAEWASIWSGLPCYLHNAYSNEKYGAMPEDYHIMKRLMMEFEGKDFFPVWITGKGNNIKGNDPDSPHYNVYKSIVMDGHPGIYHGDVDRENYEVYQLAHDALLNALTHDNFCCFIHFSDPDETGHLTEKYLKYCVAALLVDQLVAQLMTLLPADVDIIYCSDHGFNFTELGEVEDNHMFAPKGMVATNFNTSYFEYVSRQSVGRLIYKRMGGNPDYCGSKIPYALYGVDL